MLEFGLPVTCSVIQKKPEKIKSTHKVKQMNWRSGSIKHKALRSNPSTVKKKREREKNRAKKGRHVERVPRTLVDLWLQLSVLPFLSYSDTVIKHVRNVCHLQPKEVNRSRWWGWDGKGGKQDLRTCSRS
jgi:hypothetical protein